MADIELVIKIPEEDYKFLREAEGCRFSKTIIDGVINGTPLPKGHGDFITKEQAIELVEFYQINPQHFDFVNLIEDIKGEKPIIEADKE